MACLLGLFSLTSIAQQSYDWEELFEELYASNEKNVDAKEGISELLIDLPEHSLNLSTISRDELVRIPFPAAKQIEDIQTYVYQYHGVRSLDKLVMVESLNVLRCQLLSYFIYVSPVEEQRQFSTLKSIIRGEKHTILLTGHIPFCQREGDQKDYLDYPYAHSFRYSFRYGGYAQAGSLGARDAGEPFFAYGSRLDYDHYSFYLLLREMGHLRTLTVGRYKVSFGQELIINNSFGFGKLAMLSMSDRQSTGIRAHSSRSAANYLQEVVATVEIAKHLDLATFLSYRNINATLTDSRTIKTILKTDYHRTVREINNKDVTTRFTVGTHLGWSSGAFRVGLSSVYSCFNKELTPNTFLYYRHYAPSRTNSWNVGADYSYQHSRWSLAGETAMDNKRSITMVNNLSYQPTSKLSLLTVQRYYGYQYTALFTRSSGDNGAVQNESGLLIGTNWDVKRSLSLMAYSDFACLSHPRFDAHTIGKTWDSLLMLTYSRQHWVLLARYRFRIRGKGNRDKTTLVSEMTQRGHLSLVYSVESRSCKSQLDVVASNYLKRGFDCMVSGSGAWKPPSWLTLNGMIGYLQATDLTSRIYIYKRGPLYSSSFPAFFGKGMHYNLFARTDLSSRLMVILRSSTTHYFDRGRISSGLQQINSSALSELDIQLRRWF